jgi:hypothetical protein
MGDFKPSGSFTDKVMNGIRNYEAETSIRSGHMRAFVFSKPVVSILGTAGILLGIFNLVRITAILISPASCL